MDLIAGGVARGRNWRDFDRRALAQGIKVEMEHTGGKGVNQGLAREIAREIAMDHLTEDPRYYDKLELMESGWLDDAIAFAANPNDSDLWQAAKMVGAAASIYHGYARNRASNPVVWALWWGLWGYLIPIVTVPVAIAQGFGRQE